MPLNGNITPSRTRTRKVRHTPGSQLLNCPDCGRSLELSAAELVEGRELDCLHCASPLLLSREYDPARDDYHWTLESEDDVLGEDRDHE